jgi:hypothetical protein
MKQDQDGNKKPSCEPGSRSENTETPYTSLPSYKKAAQLLALLREHVRRLLALLGLQGA